MTNEPLVGKLYISTEDTNLFTSLETIEQGKYCTGRVAAKSIVLLLCRGRITKPYFGEMILSLFLYDAKTYIFTESVDNKNQLFRKFFKPFTS